MGYGKAAQAAGGCVETAMCTRLASRGAGVPSSTDGQAWGVGAHGYSHLMPLLLWACLSLTQQGAYWEVVGYTESKGTSGVPLESGQDAQVLRRVGSRNLDVTWGAVSWHPDFQGIVPLSCAARAASDCQAWPLSTSPSGEGCRPGGSEVRPEKKCCSL